MGKLGGAPFIHSCMQRLCKHQHNSLSGENMENWQGNKSVIEKICGLPSPLIIGNIFAFLQRASHNTALREAKCHIMAKEV